MQPESGYTGGSWDTEPNTTTTLTGNVIYTYRFTRSGGGSESKPYLRFDSNGGTEFDPIDENGRDFSINVYHDKEYGDHIPTRPGYRFTGWYNTNTLRTRIDEDEILHVTSYRTVFAGWEETSVPSMLNGDDHYAYIQGYSDGTVRPNANITRAQVATIFFRLLDEDVRDDNLTTYNTFPDVDEDYWANTAISTMASLGVINGRNSGLFDPDAYITRAEFAAICARFDDSGVDGITTFTDTVGHWAEDEISRAAALGWIQGYSDGTFRPNQYITRAQAVTMINRVLCRLPEDTDDLLSGMNTWTDCHEDDWFYLAIQEATNSHDFVAKDRVYESWTDLNRAPDWSRYE
nr:S-layer homology domain-containing protein [Oscillibacter valericigenes]